MRAQGSILGGVVAPQARAPRRAASEPRAGGPETVSAPAEAEQQIVSARHDLAWLAGELRRVSAESERRGAALLDAREEGGRLSRHMATLEQLSEAIVRQVTAERAAADARVADARAQAAAAIRMAESRASAGLRAAQEAVREAAVAHAVQAECGAAVAREAHVAAPIRAAAEREAETQHTARERRLGAELEHLRRERSEHEERLRAELDQVRTEKLELRTRLRMCEHALAERERELQRERKLADEAMRWASSVERELVLSPAPAPAAPAAGDCAVKPPADPPKVLRRRGSRVRLRPAS